MSHEEASAQLDVCSIYYNNELSLRFDFGYHDRIERTHRQRIPDPESPVPVLTRAVSSPLSHLMNPLKCSSSCGGKLQSLAIHAPSGEHWEWARSKLSRFFCLRDSSVKVQPPSRLPTSSRSLHSSGVSTPLPPPPPPSPPLPRLPQPHTPVHFVSSHARACPEFTLHRCTTTTTTTNRDIDMLRRQHTHLPDECLAEREAEAKPIFVAPCWQEGHAVFPLVRTQRHALHLPLFLHLLSFNGRIIMS